MTSEEGIHGDKAKEETGKDEGKGTEGLLCEGWRVAPSRTL